MKNNPSSASLQTEESKIDWASLLATSPAVWLETLTELNGRPFRLEPYQIRLLGDRSLFRLVNKARQIGFSTIIAAEGCHSAAVSPWLRRTYEANYVSINQKEANAKIAIIRSLYHSIPDELRESGIKPELWTDAAETIAFGRPPYQGTLVSQPASAAVRGGRKDIYIDEAAHIRDFRKIYQAALPAITHGDSRITVVSTPLGQSGLFYDIATDVDAYPEYSRHSVPWWESRAMVREGAYDDALAHAAELPTIERITQYGNPKLQAIRRSFGDDIISFQTEFEATFVDESEAYFPWELVVSCRDDEQTVWTDWPDKYEPQGWLAIGMDLARDHDKTVIVVTEVIEQEGETKYIVRYVKSMTQSYDSQFAFLKALIDRVKPNRVSIDQTGVGQMFVEKAKAELLHTNVEGVTFTNQKKERWATQFKGDLQLRNVSYPAVGELLRQIHGIRRTKTEANFYRFAGIHDDYFWALILSCYGEGRVPARIGFLGG